MARDKTQSLIKAVRVGARHIAGELYETAALGARDVDRVADEALADPKAATRGADPHPLDVPAFHAPPRQAGNHRQLQAADDLPRLLGDQRNVAALRRHVVKG